MDQKIKFYYFLYFFVLALFLFSSFFSFSSIYQRSKQIHDLDPANHLFSFNEPFRGFNSSFKKARKFINKNGDLFALNDKGEVVWKYLLNEKNKMLKDPYIYKNSVFFISEGRLSYLLSLKGDLIYALKIPYHIQNFTIHKGHVYFYTKIYFKNFVIKQDILKSNILWKSPYFAEKIIDFMKLNLKAKHLYIGKKNEFIKVLDAETGKILNNTYF